MKILPLVQEEIILHLPQVTPMTTGDFIHKVNFDLGTSITYSDVTTPDPLRSGNELLESKLVFPSNITLSGVPNFIFDVESSDVTLAAGEGLSFRNVDVEESITLTADGLSDTSVSRIRVVQKRTSDAYIYFSELQIWADVNGVQTNVALDASGNWSSKLNSTDVRTTVKVYDQDFDSLVVTSAGTGEWVELVLANPIPVRNLQAVILFTKPTNSSSRTRSNNLDINFISSDNTTLNTFNTNTGGNNGKFAYKIKCPSTLPLRILLEIKMIILLTITMS